MTDPFESPFWDTITDDVSGLTEFSSGSDRVVGILGGAIMDAALDRALSKALIDDPSAYAKLLGEYGPLSSAGHKTNLGYLMGLFGETIRDDIARLLKIRNSFAHHSEFRSFETQRIADLCRALTTPEKMTRNYDGDVGSAFLLTTVEGDRLRRLSMAVKDRGEKLRRPRWRFEVTVQLICYALREYNFSRPERPGF